MKLNTSKKISKNAKSKAKKKYRVSPETILKRIDLLNETATLKTKLERASKSLKKLRSDAKALKVSLKAALKYPESLTPPTLPDESLRSTMQRAVDEAGIGSNSPPPLPSGSLEGTSTERGNSFYRKFNECPRLWFLTYAAQLRAPDIDGAFTARKLGSLYHAHLTGIWTPRTLELKVSDPLLNAQAEELAKARRALVTKFPLPEIGGNVLAEETYDVPGLPMTTQPDITTEKEALDFKTAARFGQTDVTRYDVDPQIIAEMLGAERTSATVDILVKTKEPRVEQVKVELTEHKAELLRQTIERNAFLLNQAWATLHADGPVDFSRDAKIEGYPATQKAFPHDAYGCAGKFGRPCDFYKFCHGNEASRSMFLTRVEAPIVNEANPPAAIEE